MTDDEPPPRKHKVSYSGIGGTISLLGAFFITKAFFGTSTETSVLVALPFALLGFEYD